MLSLVSLALAAAAPQCPLPAENRVFDRVRSSFPFSIANAMAVSPDGRYIYAGEGGSIAILDTELANGEGYGADAPRIPISTFGARPAKILVDPGPDPEAGDDMLIICAGRSGLWAMDAQPSILGIRAAVVDDSGDGVVTTQNSRRFCNDAVIFSIDGTKYVAVTFARRNMSRLRIYELAAVRGVLASTSVGVWSGHEISALYEVNVPKRPGMLTQTDPSTSTHNYSLTIGLDVDQVDADEAVLYLALWHQGLGRVRVAADPTGGLDVSPLAFGPVFGTGSDYYLATQPPDETYSDFVIHDGAEVYRRDPPVFTDVAVQNFCDHYLYATIDTLGWVRFDLDDTWSESMPISMHEGTPYPPDPAQHPFGEIQFALADDYTYPKQVDVIQTGPQAGLLAVTSSAVSILPNVGYRTEGSVFNYGAATFNGIPARYFLRAEGGLILGQGGLFLYELDCEGGVGPPMLVSTEEEEPSLEPPAEDDEDAEGPFSVRAILPAGQDATILPGPGVGEAMLFVHDTEKTAKYLLDLTSPMSYVELGYRKKSARAGYESFVIGYSVTNPDVLMLGTNDGGFPTPGILATCGSDMVRFFEPNEVGGDGRFANGNFFDQEGQWPVLTDNEYAGMQFAMGTNNFRYRLRLYDPGDPCGVPSVEPRLIHTWLIETRTHRFGARDRWYFQGTVNDDYDADTGREMLFVSGTQSPEGIVAFDRQKLEDWVFAHMGGDPANSETDVLNIAEADNGVVVAKLNTDPEFSNVPGAQVEPETQGFLQLQQFPGNPEPVNIASRLSTFTPRTMKLPSESGGLADTWVLAAPCGFVDNGEQDTDDMGQHFVSYTNHPNWKTDPSFGEFTRLMIQFWNVDDPTTLPSADAGPDPKGVPALTSFVGGFDSAMALYLNVLEHLGRTYLFVGDFGGRVQVLDVTDILWKASNPIETIETWTPTLSLTDNLPNNVWEVAVDRAQWSSGGEDFDEIYVYVAVERVGIEVLRFDPGCAPGNRLQKVGLIQTPGNVRSMVIRDTGGDKSLILTDGEAGLRVLEYNF